MDETIRNLEDQFEATTQTASIHASTPGNIGASTNRINMPGANQQQNQGQLVLQVTNQVDSRSIKTITLSNWEF
jgi:hypothetical protein